MEPTSANVTLNAHDSAVMQSLASLTPGLGWNSSSLCNSYGIQCSSVDNGSVIGVYNLIYIPVATNYVKDRSLNNGWFDLLYVITKSFILYLSLSHSSRIESNSGYLRVVFPKVTSSSINVSRKLWFDR